MAQILDAAALAAVVEGLYWIVRQNDATTSQREIARALDAAEQRGQDAERARLEAWVRHNSDCAVDHYMSCGLAAALRGGEGEGTG